MRIHINYKHPFPFNKKIGGEINKAIYNYIMTIEHHFPIKLIIDFNPR